MAEDIEKIYEAMVNAQAARDASLEAISEAYRTLRAAEKRMDDAIEALSEWLGQEGGQVEGGDFGGLSFNLSNLLKQRDIKDIFGDLF